MSIKNVIIVGASGNLGPTLLFALLQSKSFNISVLTRHATSSSTFPDHITVHVTDYTAASLESALSGQDAVVCAIAGAGLAEQKKIIDAAVKCGVKRFIPSEFGGNTANKEAQLLVPVFQRKVDIAEYLASTSESHPSFTWTGLVTGPFFDRSLKLGFLGFDIINQKAVIYDDGERKFTATTLKSVGQSVVGILRNTEETKNKYVYVGSFTVTQNEVLSELEAASGVKWEVEMTKSDERIGALKTRVSRRDSTAIRPLVTAATYNANGGSDFEKDEKLSNVLFGLPEEDLQTVVKQVLG